MNKSICIVRYFSNSVSLNAIKTVTVVGGGIMGSGIAQVAAQTGQNVTIVDLTPEILEKAKKSIQGKLKRIARKIHKDDATKVEAFVKEASDRINVSTKLEDGVNVDLIVEAVVEKLDVKQDLFNKLDQLCPEHTILASNTSSISINEIGAGIKRKDRFGGLHFFNPATVMRLLEVIKSDSMSEETYQALMSWGKAIGKTCITCKDTPAFIVNRLLGPLIAESSRMYERGDASKEDIDIGMKLGAGLPIGPIELSDYIGLDTCWFTNQVLYERTKQPVFRPINILDKMLADGKLGIKTREGYYKYGV